MNNLKYPDNIPHMGPTYSILQTAATWLGIKGVDHLITCGIDPEGGYHPMFKHKTSVWTPETAKVTETKFHNIARHYNYSVHRMNNDGTTTQQL